MKGECEKSSKRTTLNSGLFLSDVMNTHYISLLCFPSYLLSFWLILLFFIRFYVFLLSYFLNFQFFLSPRSLSFFPNSLPFFVQHLRLSLFSLCGSVFVFSHSIFLCISLVLNSIESKSLRKSTSFTKITKTFHRIR